MVAVGQRHAEQFVMRIRTVYVAAEPLGGEG